MIRGEPILRLYNDYHDDNDHDHDDDEENENNVVILL